MAQLSKEMLAFVEDYGEAYVRFGHPKLMGRIVGLLLCQEQAISLDEIVELLNVSKGPVSQITQRLRERKLIERRWVPGDRKDYFEIHTNVFGNAFRNLLTHFHLNLDLAKKHLSKLDPAQKRSLQKKKDALFLKRLVQMEQFYLAMLSCNEEFIQKWEMKVSKS